MKLKTKLLPLAGVAVAAAAITPFVASCQSKDSYKGNWSWSIEEGAYAPKHAPRAYEKLTAETQSDVNSAALDMWFDDVAKNYNVFYDDLATPRFGASGARWQTYMGILPISAEMKVTDVNKSNHTISFDYALHAYAMDQIAWVYNIEGEAGGPYTITWETALDYTFMNTQFTAKLTNIPFTAISEMDGRYCAPRIIVDQDAFIDLDWNIDLSIEQMGSTNSYTFNNDNVPTMVQFPRVAPWGTYDYFNTRGWIWSNVTEDDPIWAFIDGEGDTYQFNLVPTLYLTQFMFNPSLDYDSGYYTAPYHFQFTYWTLSV